MPRESHPQPVGEPEEGESLLAAGLEDTAGLPADLGQSGYDVTPERENAGTRTTN